MLSRHIARSATLFAVALLLSGCASEYSADITNHSQRPVFAAIFEQAPKTGFKMLATTTVQPDDQKTVSQAKPAGAEGTSQIFIVIDSSPNPKSARRISLSKGTTRFEVVQLDPSGDPEAPIQVNQLP